MTPEFWILELRETRQKRLHRPEIQTFFYNGMADGFTIEIDKAMRFNSHEDAYGFIQRHGLFSFDVIGARKKDINK